MSLINKNVSEHFVCPITLQVMDQPVTNIKTGHNYERRAILQWIYSGNSTCPLTREKLRVGDLVDNDTLRCEIRQWKGGKKTQHARRTAPVPTVVVVRKHEAEDFLDLILSRADREEEEELESLLFEKGNS